MLIDGIDLVEGSQIANATVATGSSLIAVTSPNQGELFFLTTTEGTNIPGLYLYDGSQWVMLTEGNTAGGQISSGSSITYGSTFPSNLLGDGTLFYKTDNTDSEGVQGWWLLELGTWTLVVEDASILSGTISNLNLPTIPWSDITSTPLTLSGYGISDAVAKQGTAPTAGTFNTVTINNDGLVTSGSLQTTLAGIGIVDGVQSNSPITAGTATKITYDTKGLVTAGASLAANDIPNLSWSILTSGVPTTLTGYGITDAVYANAPITGGTFTKISFDSKGLVTGGASLTSSDLPPISWSNIDNTSTPTTLSGYGITDAVHSNNAITAGTAAKITYDTKGLVTGGTTLSASDIPGIDWAKIISGKPTTLSDYGITNGVVANSAITAGSGAKISYDTKGLVTGSGSLLASDIPSLDGSKITSGNIVIVQDNYIVVPTPTAGFSSNYAVNKAYVDSAIAGLTWQSPVSTSDLINDQATTPPGSPAVGNAYIAGASSTGAWAGKDGHLFEWSGSAWIDVLGRAVTTGDRFLVTAEHGGTAAGGLTGKAEDIAQVTGGSAGSFTYSFTTPTTGIAVFNSASSSYDFGHAYTYVGSAWVEFAGPTATPAGVGLYYTGNTLNVSLGAGIAELPTSEVGVDVYSSGGLFLTTDGSTASTNTAAQVAIKLNGSTLSTSASGLKVADGGITATQLASSVVGNGLAGAAGTALSVLTADSSNISVNSLGINLATTGVSANTYTSVTVDAYGRVTGGTNPGFLSSNQTITLSGDASGSGTTAITVTLANVTTAATGTKVTYNAKGLVTGSTTLSSSDIPSIPWSKLNTTPTTLSGYGISDAIQNVSGVPSVQAGTVASRPTAGTTGRLYVGSDTLALYRDNGASWDLVQPAITGDISVAAGTTTSTLATQAGLTAGTYNNVTVNVKGLVTAASNVSYLNSTQTLTLAGDLSSSATALSSGTISATLATVNSNTGTFGSATQVAQFTVNGKGLVTSVSNVTVTPAFSSVTGKPTTLSGYGITDAVNSSLLGATNGVATLDGSGKLTSSQIPASLVGAVVYQGTWNASTNSPALASGVGTKGNYYRVSVTGTTSVDGISQWNAGDTIIFDGTTWDKIDGLANEVISVAGRTGAVVLSNSDISGLGTLATQSSNNVSITGGTITGTTITGSVSGNAGSATNVAGGAANEIVYQTGSGATSFLPAPSSANTFLEWNGTNFIWQASAGNPTITVTGDVTGSGTTSIALTLATVNSNTGTFGSATQVPSITVNGKGLVTAVSAVTVTPAWSSITGTPTTIAGYGITDAQAENTILTSISGLSTASTGLIKLTNGVASFDSSTYLTANQSITVSGDATGSGTTAITLTLANVATAGTYGSVTVNAKGLVTAGTNPTTLSGYGITDAVNSSLLGANSGVATLDSSGKLTTSQIPTSLVGALQYQGTWNASTNSPTLVSSTGTKGQYYKVSNSGTTTIDGISSWTAGDLIIFDGITWDKVDGNPNEVLSVAGRTGAVTLTSSDVGLGNVTNVAQLASTQTLAITGDITASATALSTGTITTTLATQAGLIAGTYNNSATQTTPFTINAKGLVTATGAGVTITPAWGSITSKPTTISGFGITDSLVNTVAGRSGTVTLSTSDITGLGTIATQSASSVAITGGAIDGATVGATTAAAGKFTTLQATSGINSTAIGATTASTGRFTTLVATTGIDSTVIGAATPAAATFTTATATTFVGALSGNASTATSATSATTATNVAGGVANQIVYQTGAGATSFITAPSSSNTFLQWNGSAFVWTASAGNQTITLSGDATGSGTTAITVTLNNVVTAGTYSSVTVNTKGLVTAGSQDSNLTYGKVTSGQLVTTTTTAGQALMSFSATTYRALKFIIQVTSGTAYQVSEVMVIHDGTTPALTEYGYVATGSNLASYDATISGGNVQLTVTPVNAASTFNIVATAINI